MRTLLFLLLFSLFAFAQQEWTQKNIFSSTVDSIPDITSADTVDYRLLNDGVAPTAWSDYGALFITAANKTNEQTVVFTLNDDGDWGYAKYLEIRIRNSAESVSASKTFYIGRTLGKVTLWVVCDTTENGANDYTRYSSSVIGGN
jgi:hypothetical protein